MAILGQGAEIDELIPKSAPSPSCNSENTLQNDMCFHNGMLHGVEKHSSFNNTFNSSNNKHVILNIDDGIIPLTLISFLKLLRYKSSQ
jgi:hypothetical protein